MLISEPIASFLAFWCPESSTVKKEVVAFSETLIPIFQTARCHMLDDRNLSPFSFTEFEYFFKLKNWNWIFPHRFLTYFLADNFRDFLLMVNIIVHLFPTIRKVTYFQEFPHLQSLQNENFRKPNFFVFTERLGRNLFNLIWFQGPFSICLIQVRFSETWTYF